jgi:predicted AAA+ superfamily ATPase
VVLQRLSGVTQNAPPVLTLVTQFGGGKTHTLTALFHLANAGKAAAAYRGVRELLDSAGLSECPGAKVAAFVGNAWDPRPGCEAPWLDLADRLAGAEGFVH